MDNKYNFSEFKKIIADFTNDILITFPELLSNLDKNLLKVIKANNDKKVDKTTDKSDDGNNSDNSDNSDSRDEELSDCINEIFEYCNKIYPERFFDILYQNVEIFDNTDIDTKFLPGINFSLLWKENISEKTRVNIWKYLQLILFTIVTNIDNKNTFGDTARLFEAINEDEFKEKLEETIKGLEDIFDISNQEPVQDSSKNPFDSIPNPKEIHDHINTIMNGKLGELAKELAEETAKEFDINDVNIKDPKDIFKSLFKNPQKLMNLVKNVGTKLDEKMKSGDIKESELLEEASSMFNNMKNIPGMEGSNMQDIFNNFNIADIMKNMGMMPPGAKFNQNAFNSKMEQTMKSSKTKDRMRSKLDENKKQVEQAKTQNMETNESQSLDKNIQNNIQNNLDFLFNNGSDLTKLNGDLQKLVEEMKITNQNVNNDSNNINKKKKKGKKK